MKILLGIASGSHWPTFKVTEVRFVNSSKYDVTAIIRKEMNWDHQFGMQASLLCEFVKNMLLLLYFANSSKT